MNNFLKYINIKNKIILKIFKLFLIYSIIISLYIINNHYQIIDLNNINKIIINNDFIYKQDIFNHFICVVITIDKYNFLKPIIFILSCIYLFGLTNKIKYTILFFILFIIIFLIIFHKISLLGITILLLIVSNNSFN